MRTLAPADSLVYLETNDLAAALQPIVDSKPFNEVAKYKPDFSPLKGVQLAVAVTGFETSEEKLTDENSIGRIQPHFVAIADTHAWNYQAVKFAEQKLGSFVEKIYDSQPTLETSDKNGGKYFTWTAQDGRKGYALVIDSLIYFGNDESSIEKCLAVRRGEADSIAKIDFPQPVDPSAIASGYLSADGVAQIANIIGLSSAMETAEEPEVKSFLAAVIPGTLRNAIRRVQWSARQTEKGIEDRYYIALNPDLTLIYKTTFGIVADQAGLEQFVPDKAISTTQYSIRDPQIAWRSVILSLGSNMPDVSGALINSFSNSLFEPYAIQNGELFLSSISGSVRTVQLDDDEGVAVISRSKDLAGLKTSILTDIDLAGPSERVDDFDVWKSSDGDYAVAIGDDTVVLGNSAAVLECLSTKRNGGGNFGRSHTKQYEQSGAAVFTVAKDTNLGATLVRVLAQPKNEETPLRQNRYISTSFFGKEMQRTVISDFGMIGWIIAQLNEE